MAQVDAAGLRTEWASRPKVAIGNRLRYDTDVTHSPLKDRLEMAGRSAESMIRRLYLPSLLLAGVTAGFVVAAVTSLHRAGALNAVTASSRSELAGPAVIGFVLVVLTCERIWPVERRKVLAAALSAASC